LVLRTLQNISTCCKFNVVLGTYSTAWELMLRRISLCTLVYVFFVPSKVNRTWIRAFSLVYIFQSDRLDTVVLLHSIHWMYETGSCTGIWNVQETDVICSLFQVRVTRRAAQFCTRYKWFVRDRGILYKLWQYVGCQHFTVTGIKYKT